MEQRACITDISLLMQATGVTCPALTQPLVSGNHQLLCLMLLPKLSHAMLLVPQDTSSYSPAIAPIPAVDAATAVELSPVSCSPWTTSHAVRDASIAQACLRLAAHSSTLTSKIDDHRNKRAHASILGVRTLKDLSLRSCRRYC
jgi:hypothetical protein